MAPIPGFASSIGPATIEQPVNLGLKSDPARIPLGSIGVLCNHDYGLHENIGASRPCPEGAMRWDGGTELDQNLASVFGISVEVQDSTQIREFPVTLRMKSWKPPGYSPYTKDQVLAATLWCLVRSAGGTPEKPLDVRVVAEGLDDKSLEAKYSGKYVTQPGKDGGPVPPVPGTVIEQDARGIAWVVFPDVTRKAASPPPPSAMIILATGGESDSGWYLLPIWGNRLDEGASLDLSTASVPLYRAGYRSGGGNEANTFLADGGSDRFEVKGDEVLIDTPRVPQATLAAEILALVLSAQPTETQPLTVTIRLEEYGLARYPAFRGAPGWKETRHDAQNITLECEFVWDAAARKLAKGAVPLVQLDASGHFISPIPETPAMASDARELAENVRFRIGQGLHDETLLAEKNMTSDTLAESGLRRQIGLAGYYEALATFFNKGELSDKPIESTALLGNSEFDQLHHMGWTIGVNRGQAIVMEASKTIEEAKLKKSK
ncbi:MAG: hypothetical protein ABI162_09335 [Luteolibacter sp.]